MSMDTATQSLESLRELLRPFCQKHGIRRLDVFGSAVRGQLSPRSDVDLLVAFDEDAKLSTGALLEMAGEAEELLGRPVDFVLRRCLERATNRFAREHILSTLVPLYGS